MKRAVNLIVSCTNRKRYGVPPGMAVHEIQAPDPDARLHIWKERLRHVPAEEHPANETYMGDHWSIARSIPQEAARAGLDVRVWVCSAGYGLIQPGTPIKPYRATFSPGTPDYVASGITGNGGAVQSWWAGVCTHRFRKQATFPRSLLALAEASPRTPMVVALSVDYLRAVTQDLIQVLGHQFFKEHLSIISCGTDEDHPLWKQNLLPCNAMLSGALGGALTSLNVRVARFLFRSLKDTDPTVEHFATLARSIGQQSRSIPERANRSDREVAEFIHSRLKTTPAVTRTRLLTEFRSSGQACEQKRFAQIYARIRQVGPPELYA